jgi:hypothetical protein
MLNDGAALMTRLFHLKLDRALVISRHTLNQGYRLSLRVSDSRLSRTQLALETLYDVLRMPRALLLVGCRSLDLRGDPIKFCHESVVRAEDGTVDIAELLEILPNIIDASEVDGVFQRVEVAAESNQELIHLATKVVGFEVGTCRAIGGKCAQLSRQSRGIGESILDRHEPSEDGIVRSVAIRAYGLKIRS